MRYLITWIDKFNSTDGQYIASNKKDAECYLNEQGYSKGLVKQVMIDGEYLGKYDTVKMQKLKDLK